MQTFAQNYSNVLSRLAGREYVVVNLNSNGCEVVGYFNSAYRALAYMRHLWHTRDRRARGLHLLAPGGEVIHDSYDFELSLGEAP